MKFVDCIKITFYWILYYKNTFENLNANYNPKTIVNDTDKGVEFNLDATNDHKDYNVVYFPAMGNLHPETGVSNQYASWVNLHALNDNDGNDNNNCFSFELRINANNKINSIYLDKQTSKAKGLSVRCIRERAQTSGNDYNNDKKNEEYNQVPW